MRTETFTTSTEYLRIPVSAPGITLGTQAVQIGFRLKDSTSTKWFVAGWDQGQPAGSTRDAVLLTGPTGTALQVGIYDVFVKFTDVLESPVIRAGKIVVHSA